MYCQWRRSSALSSNCNVHVLVNMEIGITGIGGDNSDAAIGSFFEGVLTKGYSSDAADDAVQANIVSVYGSK